MRKLLLLLAYVPVSILAVSYVVFVDVAPINGELETTLAWCIMWMVVAFCIGIFVA